MADGSLVAAAMESSRCSRDNGYSLLLMYDFDSHVPLILFLCHILLDS